MNEPTTTTNALDAPDRKSLLVSLQTEPAAAPRDDDALVKAAGFSLHAGVWAGANDRPKLERLCRYIARPAVANERIALTECGHVRYTLKTPYRDGTTHVYFNPLDFIARLAALVPKPRVNLTRYHGVFAPNSKLRWQVTLSGRGKRPAHTAQTATERHQAMAGFCSCKTGIHAIHGNNVGTATQAGVSDRYSTVQMWRPADDTGEY